jgi:exopolysaccharide biosynthesis polyprenyl glycosylphosphotransferase
MVSQHPGSIQADSVTIVERIEWSRSSLLAKRLLDLAVASFLLACALPLMFMAAALVRLDSPGPALYRQLRVGLNGIPFTLLKLRSMVVDAEGNGPPRWATCRDPRITRVGRIIRRFRIDELPQLINVLRGEMSLVGPRPERPHFVEQLSRVIPFYRDRVRVKPGLTGWAQINLPYGASIEDAREKLAYDLFYLKHQSLRLDLLILLSTVRVILRQEGSR